MLSHTLVELLWAWPNLQAATAGIDSSTPAFRRRADRNPMECCQKLYHVFRTWRNGVREYNGLHCQNILFWPHELLNFKTLHCSAQSNWSTFNQKTEHLGRSWFVFCSHDSQRTLETHIEEQEVLYATGSVALQSQCTYWSRSKQTWFISTYRQCQSSVAPPPANW